VADDKKK